MADRHPADESGRTLSPRRRWAAVVITTIVIALSYVSLLLGLGGIGGSDSEATGAALGTGLTVMPLAFMTATFMTSHRHPARAIVGAVAAWLVVVGLVAFDVVVGLIAAYTAGAAVSLERPPGASWRHRIIVSAVFVVVVAMARALAPAATVLTAPIAICLVVQFADDLSRHRAGPTTR